MGQIETNVTIKPGSSKSITGYRSGTTGTAHDVKNVCDVRVTAQDPFDFSVDYRVKYVNVRRYKKSKRGRFYPFYETVPVPYPFYEFVTKTRTVREWRLVISAGMSVIKQLPEDLKTPHILQRYKWLAKRLKRYGPCRPTKPRSAGIMHNVLAWSSEIDLVPPEGDFPSPPLPNTTYQPLITNGKWEWRAFQPTHEGSQYAGTKGSGINAMQNSIFNQYTFVDPVNKLEAGVSTIVAMLWPESGDFEDIGATPLVDIAEAASDGVFPLGPPPNPVDAHKRMTEHALNDDILKSMKETVDFTANSWLWTTLVLEPVIQSAVGLAASVEANDKAIEAFQAKARSGQWHQGKSLRIYGENAQNAAEACGAPMEFSLSETHGGDPAGTLHHEFKYDKFEGNAALVYKLSQFDGIHMNSSGQRLGQFFNRLSVSLDTVLYNVIPLSFVYDWFSSEFAGTLNLKDKVYMPLESWKLSISHNVEVAIESTAVSLAYSHRYWRWYMRGDRLYDCSPNYTSKRRLTLEEVSHLAEPFHTCSTTNPYARSWYESIYLDFKEYKVEGKYRERHTYYKRWIYNNPARRTDFSTGVSLECLETLNSDPLEDTGKQVTLGALIWGILT